MIKLKLTLFFIVISVGLIAQTTEAEKELINAEKILKKQNKDSLDGWKSGSALAINLTQTSLTNWAAGGDNSISVNGTLGLFANYKKGNASWENSLDLAYGILQQGNEHLRKTDDKIDFTSKYGRKAVKSWFYAALINFKSQMTAGYNYPDDSNEISNFMAPAYILSAIGMDYKPNKTLTLFVSPITMKTTIVNDQKLANAGAYGVDRAKYDALGNLITKGKTIRSEYGGYLRGIFKKEIMKNINFQNKIELFSNYSEEPDHVDVNWEILLDMKVNKYISATVSTQLIYDHDVDIAVDENGDDIIDAIGPRVQFKEIIGVGLSFKF